MEELNLDFFCIHFQSPVNLCSFNLMILYTWSARVADNIYNVFITEEDLYVQTHHHFMNDHLDI
jgi:hypothetical protein